MSGSQNPETKGKLKVQALQIPQEHCITPQEPIDGEKGPTNDTVELNEVRSLSKRLDWREICIIVVIFAPFPAEYQVSAFLLTFLVLYLANKQTTKAKFTAFLASLIFPAYSGILASVVSEIPMPTSEKVALGILSTKIIQNLTSDSEHSSLAGWSSPYPYTYFNVCAEFGVTFTLTQFPGLLGLSGSWISVVILFIQSHRTGAIPMLLLALIMRFASVLNKKVFHALFAMSSLYPVGLVSATIAQELLSNKPKDSSDNQVQSLGPLDSDNARELEKIRIAIDESLNQSIEMLPCLVGPLLAYKDQTQRWRLFSVVGVVSYRFVDLSDF